jgi:hypothetical protein
VGLFSCCVTVLESFQMSSIAIITQYNKDEIILRFPIEDGLLTVRFGVRIPSGGNIFVSSPKCHDHLWSPPILLFGGYRSLFPRINRLGSEVDNSPLSSAKSKNGWNCTYYPSMHIYLVDKENYTFFYQSMI